VIASFFPFTNSNIEKKIINHPADFIYKILIFSSALEAQVQGHGKERTKLDGARAAGALHLHEAKKLK
jgi:hypothetical protein